MTTRNETHDHPMRLYAEAIDTRGAQSATAVPPYAIILVTEDLEYTLTFLQRGLRANGHKECFMPYTAPTWRCPHAISGPLAYSELGVTPEFFRFEDQAARTTDACIQTIPIPIAVVQSAVLRGRGEHYMFYGTTEAAFEQAVAAAEGIPDSATRINAKKLQEMH